MTVKVATAGVALFPLLVCNAPAGTVLVKVPATAAVTSAINVQEPFAGIAPCVKPTVEVPITNHAGERAG